MCCLDVELLSAMATIYSSLDPKCNLRPSAASSNITIKTMPHSCEYFQHKCVTQKSFVLCTVDQEVEERLRFILIFHTSVQQRVLIVYLERLAPVNRVSVLLCLSVC